MWSFRRLNGEFVDLSGVRCRLHVVLKRAAAADVPLTRITRPKCAYNWRLRCFYTDEFIISYIYICVIMFHNSCLGTILSTISLMWNMACLFGLSKGQRAWVVQKKGEANMFKYIDIYMYIYYRRRVKLKMSVVDLWVSRRESRNV